MTSQEWEQIALLVAALWPQHPWPKVTVTAAAPLFQELEVEFVRTALETLAGEGDPWPPAPPVLLRRALELRDSSRSALPPASELELRDPTLEEIEARQRWMPVLRRRIAELARSHSLANDRSPDERGEGDSF